MGAAGLCSCSTTLTAGIAAGVSGLAAGSRWASPGFSAGAAIKLKVLERNSIAVVMIRLARVGARKQPYYRVVVIEKDRARNGRSIEVVGTYNPRTNPASVNLKMERIAYWRGVGAQMSPIVAKLVAKAPAAALAVEAPAADSTAA